MKSFLVLSTGTDASTATPLFATADADVIAAALGALLDRVGVSPLDEKSVLRTADGRISELAPGTDASEAAS